MRALTVKQPWASLIASGIKHVENRTYPVPKTMLGGVRFAIHAGKGFDAKWQEKYPCTCGNFLATEPECRYGRSKTLCNPCEVANQMLNNGKAKELTQLAGRVLCTARIVASIEHSYGMDFTTIHATDQLSKKQCYDTTFWQRGPCVYGWILADIEPVESANTHKGMLGFWTVKGEL